MSLRNYESFLRNRNLKFFEAGTVSQIAPHRLYSSYYYILTPPHSPTCHKRWSVGGCVLTGTALLNYRVILSDIHYGEKRKRVLASPVVNLHIIRL